MSQLQTKETLNKVTIGNDDLEMFQRDSTVFLVQATYSKYYFKTMS